MPHKIQQVNLFLIVEERIYVIQAVDHHSTSQGHLSKLAGQAVPQNLICSLPKRIHMGNLGLEHEFACWITVAEPNARKLLL